MHGWGCDMKLLLIAILAMSATTAAALQDPTRPDGFGAAPQAQVPEKEFTLASIFIGNDRRVAVINGQARREGQTFEGVRIRRIHPDRVELVDQGRVRVLRLEPLPQVRSSQ
ncbi:MAG: T2bSS MSH-type system biogenesis protein MshK [Marinobacter sp. HL-58]|nr:MAG: T2bSS MSH-type system biogenesis protein MshK [Marinobacter sp. HL-58]